MHTYPYLSLSLYIYIYKYIYIHTMVTKRCPCKASPCPLELYNPPPRIFMLYKLSRSDPPCPNGQNLRNT